ncbi:glycosyltransferase family 39 protein, partial [bacterium]|nr:glycosyltransferase family 39 protein [bacterium]
NGFWGPLLSWILIPFISFKINHFTAINIISAITGILALIGIRQLSFKFKISTAIRNAIIVCSLPIVVQSSLIETQDFILVALLIYYLNIMLRKDYATRHGLAAAAGVIGALAYFCKSYAFPFFLAHFTGTHLFLLFSSNGSSAKKKVIITAITGLAVFAAISAGWIAQVSDKYGHFAFSTTGKNNMAAMGPEAQGEDSSNPIYGREEGWPIFYEGLLEPVNETATSAWEDPTYLKMKPWSPLSSAYHFKHFANLIFKNISQGVKILNLYSSLTFAIIFAYILLCIRPLKDLLRRPDIILPLFTISLYTAGYMLVHMEVRYLQFVNIVVLLMGGHILFRLFKTSFFSSPLRRKTLIFLFIISFIIMPVRSVIKRGHYVEDLHSLSRELRNDFHVSGNIASNKEYLGVNNSWHNTFRLAFHLDSKYYGQARDMISDSELLEEFEKYNINYYFIWGENQRIPEFLQQKVEVTQGRIPGLKIYHVQ